MIEWADTGCSVVQVASSVFAYEWILKHHDQRPYGPVQQTIGIAAIPGSALKQFAGHLQYLADTYSTLRLVVQFGSSGRHWHSNGMVGCETSMLCWQSFGPVRKLG